MVGVSSQAAGHNQLVPPLLEELKNLGSSQIKVVVGGIIPQADHKGLLDLGVGAIFTPGVSIPECAIQVVNLLNQSV